LSYIVIGSLGGVVVLMVVGYAIYWGATKKKDHKGYEPIKK
jgi:hypothetical protein